MQEKKKSRSTPLSKSPHVRRDEIEMLEIVKSIELGKIGIRAACLKHGLNRNTLKLWMTRLSIRTLNEKTTFNPIMNEDAQNRDLIHQVNQLKKSLEYAKLKIIGLETMIKVAEEDLKIKIRKKPGTKQSKESGKVILRLD